MAVLSYWQVVRLVYACFLCVAQTFGTLEKQDTTGWRVFSVSGVARDQQYNDAEFRATVVLLLEALLCGIQEVRGEACLYV